jgi:hypothetical protein
MLIIAALPAIRGERMYYMISQILGKEYWMSVALKPGNIAIL